MGRGGKKRKVGSRRRTVSSSRRPVPSRTPNKTFLIICEGKVTEPTYFDDLRKSKSLRSAHIAIVPGHLAGTTPKKLVEYAKAESKNSNLSFDEVWCVFDRDDHSKIDQALNMAQKNKIKVAFSNQCFELWYLLHFTFYTAWIHRNDVLRLLKNYIPNYDKAMKGLYFLLKDKQAFAIGNAEKLRRYHATNLEPLTKNPSTSVDILVKELEHLEIN